MKSQDHPSRWMEWLLLFAILISSGFLRLRDLDLFIASDELRWACRSINFHAALDEGRLADTFQVGHPGVITMWLGMGPEALSLEEAGAWREICQETQGGRDLGVFEDQGREGQIQSLVPLLPKLRRGIALGSTALLLLIYLLLRQGGSRGSGSGSRLPAFGNGLEAGPSLSALALLAFEPFVLAHSKVIHVDAMLSLLLVASVLALLAACRTGSESQGAGPLSSRLWGWGLAGGLAGLSMLAKSAGFLIGPIGLAAALLAAWRGQRVLPNHDSTSSNPIRVNRLRLLLTPAITFLCSAGLAYVLFWPAMWVAPLNTLIGACESETKCHEGGVFSKLFAEGAEPHQNGSYFLGEPVADPGALYYPIVSILRLSPLALAGLLAAFFLSARWISRAWQSRQGGGDVKNLGSLTGDSSSLMSTILSLLIWALIFGLFVSLAPKKQDRYVLPSICALVLAAGLSWHFLLQRLKFFADAGRRQPWMEFAPALLIFALSAGYAFSPLVQPYPLAHYNPVFGGAERAEEWVLVGWGEGYDLAAQYLNRLPDVDISKVSAASPGKANMAPLFDGLTRSLAGYEPGRTDYVVMYRSQVQRRKPTAEDKNPLLLQAYFDDPELKPDFTGQINGLEMVWVYRNITIQALDARLEALTQEGDLLIAGGETVFAKHYDGPLSLHRYWGHWGEEDIAQELIPALDKDWERLWVLRYPNYDPPATLMALEKIAKRGETHPIDFRDGSRVEITEFIRP